jgi:hypothetical protein
VEVFDPASTRDLLNEESLATELTPGDPNIDHHLEKYAGFQAVLTEPLPSNGHILHNSVVSKSKLPSYLTSFDAFLLNPVDIYFTKI